MPPSSQASQALEVDNAKEVNKSLSVVKLTGLYYDQGPWTSLAVRMLPDAERFGEARYIGAYWNRTGTIEVDLVGGDERPVAKRIGFLGSVKWRQERPFDRSDALALAGRRRDVPGAAEALLVGVSSQGFDDAATLDVRLGPEDLIDAWRR